MEQQTVFNPVLPYIGPIHSHLYPGLLIRIRGKVSPPARCFAINLQTGPSINPRDDIVLHLSPVFTAPPRVVRNSLQNQTWGPEESYGGFPFSENANYEILILSEVDNLKIAINGQHFSDFRQRIPLNLASHIVIDGDTIIKQIKFESNPSIPSAPSAPPPLKESLPYPTDPSAMPPYPPSAGPTPYPTEFPQSPYPTSHSSPYPSVHPTSYPSAMPMPSSNYPSANPIPPNQYGAPSYPSRPANYPTASEYPPAGYPPAGYPPSGAYPHSATGYPSGAYPSHKPTSKIGGLISSIPGASMLLGSSGQPSGLYGHKKSSPIPIGGIAAGVGAAALGATLLGHHPMKKMKKLYKHKIKKPKFFKHKFHGGWKHKGWSSSSSD